MKASVSGVCIHLVNLYFSSFSTRHSVLVIVGFPWVFRTFEKKQPLCHLCILSLLLLLPFHVIFKPNNLHKNAAESFTRFIKSIEEFQSITI